MIGFSLIPSIFLILGTLLMLFYPLDSPQWFVQKTEIMKIHEKKEIEYLKFKIKIKIYFIYEFLLIRFLLLVRIYLVIS